MLHYIYDGTFDGFLTAVWEAMERDELPETIVTEDKLELVKPADSQGSGAAAEARRVEVTLVK